MGNKKGRITVCTNCGKQKENVKKGYCNDCAATYMREWRKSHPLTEQQKFKNNVRRKTNMRIERGLILKYPCETCGNIESEAHHDDYTKPYDIRWLCRQHHLQHHKEIGY